MSEEQLLEAWRNGDRAAAAEIVRRHQPDLLRIVRRLVVERAVAEEIVQETFLRTFERSDRIEPGRMRGWLLVTALNFAREHMRRRRRSPVDQGRDASDDGVAPVDPSSPETALIDSEERRRYRAALSTLPHKLREVVVLHYGEAISFVHMARMLGVPAPVLRMRAMRARVRLTALLAEERS